jgi:hypothetical protein
MGKIESEQEVIIIGDLNGKVKSKTNDKRVGWYGESEQNDNGVGIVELRNEEDMTVLINFLNINKFIRIHGNNILRR